MNKKANNFVVSQLLKEEKILCDKIERAQSNLFKLREQLDEKSKSIEYLNLIHKIDDEMVNAELERFKDSIRVDPKSNEE